MQTRPAALLIPSSRHSPNTSRPSLGIGDLHKLCHAPQAIGDIGGPGHVRWGIGVVARDHATVPSKPEGSRGHGLNRSRRLGMNDLSDVNTAQGATHTSREPLPGAVRVKRVPGCAGQHQDLTLERPQTHSTLGITGLCRPSLQLSKILLFQAIHCWDRRVSSCVQPVKIVFQIVHDRVRWPRIFRPGLGTLGVLPVQNGRWTGLFSIAVRVADVVKS
mmetsp:Transcript_11236/g.25445  ORF Transcript_11236/g.25445 Transcript_11236/m.25445 type:complete len:218 (-) Transcript_11236:33-686(-)